MRRGCQWGVPKAMNGDGSRGGKVRKKRPRGLAGWGTTDLKQAIARLARFICTNFQKLVGLRQTVNVSRQAPYASGAPAHADSDEVPNGLRRGLIV
jgi:hypothetical protein